MNQRRDRPDVRLNVKLSYCDFPLLSQELANVPKGPRRTNRIAHLATLGLVWENTKLVDAGSSIKPDSLMRDPSVETEPTSRAYQCRLDSSQVTALLGEDADA